MLGMGLERISLAKIKAESKQVMDYWVATAYNGGVPAGLFNLEIPASQWAVFEVHGPMPDAIQKV
jgi:AraC family transcriptional regulator